MESTTALQWPDLWTLYCADLDRTELDNCAWLQRVPAEWPAEDASPVEVCDWMARLYSARTVESHRKAQGQFFTPPTIARFMAQLSLPLVSGAHVVEPGAGCGILIAGLGERIVSEKLCRAWSVVAYETDGRLRPLLSLSFGYLRQWLSERDVEFAFEILPEDFISANAGVLRPAPLLGSGAVAKSPHLILSNPPYFKIPKTDPRIALLQEVVCGQPNIYALFMAASAKLLRPDGQLVFITPRSFCAGPYFRQFRKWLFQAIQLRRLHLFESRTSAFARDKVLQENIILAGTKYQAETEYVEISSSNGAHDLGSAQVRRAPRQDVIDVNSPQAVLNILLSSADDSVQRIFTRSPNRFHSFGLNVSTGPIIPFRTNALLDRADDPQTAPVLWLQHVRRMAIEWPLVQFSKPQWIRIDAKSRKLLLPDSNLVLVRRFSAKEENSRVTAAPYLKGDLPSDFLGVENHVNFLYRPAGTLSDNEAIGIAAYLNSQWVDQYFRLSSGNTQVSATELRNLPMPPIHSIERIGERLREIGMGGTALVNRIVGEELSLPLDLSNGSGGHMPKIEEAKELLDALGLPPAQRNELAALTLLALGNMVPDDSWRKAQRRSIRIHDMILFIERNYRKRYAENTRETFRRQVLHQFEQARIVDRNPDDPTLPTNSPRTHYALSKEALPVVQGHGTKSGQRLLESFRASQGSLLELYQQRRKQTLVPLKDQGGREYRLSPGRHNQLQALVVEQFAPRFAPGAVMLYLGDAANKTLMMDTDELARVGFPAGKHGKLPDVVLYLPKKNRLYLIEAVTSHGPVSPKRYRELEAMLSKGHVERIYVSVFPDFREYLRHARNIAWETEIWIAEAPDHLIHYNGDKFIGSTPSRKKAARR